MSLRRRARTGPELVEAVELLSQRRYADAVRLLTPQVFLYRENAVYYEIMGLSSLWLGDFASANSYYLRALDLDSKRRSVRFGLAACHLARKETTQAIAIWLDLQRKIPLPLRARRALSLIRSSPETVRWAEELRNGKHLFLFPGLPPRFPRPEARQIRVAAIALAALFLISGATVFVLSKRGTQASRPLTAQTPASNSVAPDQALAALGPNEAPLIMMTQPEAEKLMVEISDLFKTYHDNAARLGLNRLFLSNAPESIKQKGRNLVSYLRAPNFANHRDNPDFKQLSSNPRLYQGVWILLRGILRDVVVSDGSTSAHLLVNYESGHVVDAELKLVLPYASQFSDGQAVEVLSCVSVNSKAGADEEPVELVGGDVRLIKTGK